MRGDTVSYREQEGTGENAGAWDVLPTLTPADEGLPNTPLMRALAAEPDVTVAQFGQAVGSIYFSLT